MIRYLLPLVLPGFAQAFTLLSGPNEATLPVSSSEPTIQFLWDGTTPAIEDKGDFEGGLYAELDDKEFMRQLLQIAFGIWNDVGASYLSMEIVEDESAGTDTEDQQFVIVTESSDNLAAAAFALPQLDDDASTIEDCDITIADNSTSAEDLAYTLVHEIGHCIGLGHNHTNYNAIMGYSRSSRSLKLGADDVAGIIYLYPHPDFDMSRKEFLACAVAGDETSGGLGLALLILFPVVFGCIRLGSRRNIG